MVVAQQANRCTPYLMRGILLLYHIKGIFQVVRAAECDIKLYITQTY